LSWTDRSSSRPLRINGTIRTYRPRSTTTIERSSTPSRTAAQGTKPFDPTQAKVGDDLRVLDMTDPKVRDAVSKAEDAKALYESHAAGNY